MKLVLKIRGQAADFARPLSERAHHRGQLFRPDHNQRDNADEKEFGPTDVEHEKISGCAFLSRSRRSRYEAAATGARAPELDFALGFGPPFDLRGGLMIDRLYLRIRLRAAGGLVIGHAFLEGFNSARDIA